MDSNYVFLCGVMWCRYGQDDAGSELVRAAECGDPDLSALALAMLREGCFPPGRGQLSLDKVSREQHPLC